MKNTKRFYVRNPTGEPYEFFWLEESGPEGVRQEQSPFRCLTRRGTILPGKKFLMVFEYTPLEVPQHAHEASPVL